MKVIRSSGVLDSNLVSSTVPEADYPSYSASNVYVEDEFVLYVSTNIHKIYQSLTGSTSTVTMTIATPCVVTWVAHGLAANTPIVFSTTGTLPTGIVSGTVYYVKAPNSDTFNISASPGGSSINTSGVQSGIHTAKASANFNKPVTNTTYWIEVGASNRWKMFDTSVSSQTIIANSLDVVVTPAERIDTVVLVNTEAYSARVVVTDAIDGVVYDYSASLVSTDEILDFYDYFFEPINPITDYAFQNIPLYANPTVTITLTNTGNNVACGGCVLGLSKDFSDQGMGSEYGVKLGIQDYSLKQRDAYGNYSILERAFNKRVDLTVYVPNSLVDSLQSTLAQYRATPTVYIVGGGFSSFILNAFYKDFTIDVSTPVLSVCSIQLEGLT